MTFSLAGEPQIIDMMRLRGWKHEPRVASMVHDTITFLAHRKTKLYNGGEERKPVTFSYARALRFTKNNNYLFLDSAHVAIHKGTPDPAADLKIVEAYTNVEFWTNIDTIAGAMAEVTKSEPKLLNAAEVWIAVKATAEASQRSQTAPNIAEYKTPTVT